MPIRLTDLIARVPAEVEGSVRRVRDQMRATLQEALRTETRLMMRTPEEGGGNRYRAQVPVEVSPGYPLVLETLTFHDDLEGIMLLGRYRNILDLARMGATGLVRLREELARKPKTEGWVQITENELCSTANWASALLRRLDQQDPLKTVLAVREDFLGVYEYDTRQRYIDEFEVNRAVIRIYWGVIGLVSEWMGCTVEDLAIVVLTHELAHAYTQLGADIEGRRWPAAKFGEAESGLKEGLAQYYTERVLRRLERRFGGALKVYEAMLPGQPDAYRTHVSWIERLSPEAVRRAMLEVRRWQEGKLADFSKRLEEAQKGLWPKGRPP
jgi:hypothetical protein